jgi:Ca2+-binding EF-hand superfamily protein
MDFNPTKKDLDSYQEEFDPTHKGIITRRNCTKIVDRRQKDPDTYEELVQALKIFDKTGTGQIPVPEMRYILTHLGDKMKEDDVDDVIYTLDPDSLGFISIQDYGKTCFQIKEEKKNVDGDGAQGNQGFKSGGSKPLKKPKKK